MTDPAQLYRHFDAEGNLLYVGISLHAVQRLSEHRKRARWYRSIARVTIHDCGSLAEARVAEREAIIAERPRYNIVHKQSASLSDDLRRRIIAEQAETIRDLRARLDASETEHRAILIDQRRARRSWWRRMFSG